MNSIMQRFIISEDFHWNICGFEFGISALSDKAVSAARLLGTTRLIHFDCQEIKLNLEFSSTKNIKCPPWLPPSS